MSMWPRGLLVPFFFRRYPFTTAVNFLWDGGYKLVAWGLCLPLTRHGGLVITWMRKEEFKQVQESEEK